MNTLAEIIQAAQRGDERAYPLIVQRFEDAAQGWAYAVLGDYHLAQDAVQEAFAEAFSCLAKLREPAAFPGWFKRIVIKRIDRITRGKKLPMVSLEAAGDVGESADSSSRIDTESASVSLERALNHLPDHERAIARDYYFDDFEQKDLAARHGVPVTTVKKRLYASRQRIREAAPELREFLNEPAESEGLSPSVQLFAAAWNGHASRADRLLRENPSLIHLRNEDGLSILLYAAHAAHRKGDYSVVDVLAAFGAAFDAHSAAALGIRRLLEAYIRTDAGAVRRCGAWGRTPLHWAASGGHDELAAWLVSRGADAKAADVFGCTALHAAAEMGHRTTVALLAKHDANPHARLKNGKSALHLAAQAGHYGVLEELMLLDARIDVFAATSLGLEGQVKKMLGRDPFLAKARLPYGATPLHVAAEDGQFKMAEFLVEQGVEVDVICATELGWEEQVVTLLAAAPGSVNARGGSFGHTALHSATTRGDRSLAKLLLERGAEINAKDRMFDKTPLGEALYFGNEAMARLLTEHGARG